MIKKIISEILMFCLICNIFMFSIDKTSVFICFKSSAMTLEYDEENTIFSISNKSHNGYGTIKIDALNKDKITSYLEIPEYIIDTEKDKKYRVSEIKGDVFQGNTVIETIRIPSSISIDANAFKNCTNLKTVELYEDEVTDGTISIRANAFDGYIHSIVDISDHNI